MMCRVPPDPPWEDATNRVNAIEFVIVHVETDTGIVGAGLTYSVDVGGSAIKSLVDDYLANMVIGRDPLNTEANWVHMQRQLRRLGVGANAMAIAAIDIALWDIKGKYLGQPLYRLLGGARPMIPAYASGIDLGDTLDELLQRVDRFLSRGYRIVKIKIGKDTIAEDIERIRSVKEQIGGPGRLMVDANQKWSTAEAIRHCSVLEDLDLEWIEEPLVFYDVDGHAQLKRNTRTPIALGESLHGKAQFLNFLRRDAVDIVQADVAFVGGITEWIKIAHLAEAFNRPIAPHFMMELSIHLLCGVPNGYLLEDVEGGGLSDLGLLEQQIRVTNGMAVPAERPGHGIIFDGDALKRYEVDPADLRSIDARGSK